MCSKTAHSDSHRTHVTDVSTCDESGSAPMDLQISGGPCLEVKPTAADHAGGKPIKLNICTVGDPSADSDFLRPGSPA
jgi:hypothetical protein